MLALGSGCKYRLSLAERSDCTETVINQLLVVSHQNPISEWQAKTSSGLPLILHYGELYNNFIIYYSVLIIEIKCTINEMRLNHPETIPQPRSVEKLSFMKLVPGAKKVGDPQFRKKKSTISEFRMAEPESSMEVCVYRPSTKDYIGCFQALGTTMTMSEHTEFPKMKEKERQLTFSLAKGIKMTFNPAKPYSLCLEIETHIPLTKGDDKEPK